MGVVHMNSTSNNFMKYEFSKPETGALFAITDDIWKDRLELAHWSGVNRIFWNRNEETVALKVDGVRINLQPNQLTTTTFFHMVEFVNKELPLAAVLFNRPFYCIIDHDAEVSCNGILFFGTQDIPLISLDGDNPDRFNSLWQVMIEEFQTRDKIQGEMLQMLLKRLVILCTRLAKSQLVLKQFNDHQVELIRQFNTLVDMNFKKKKLVKDYADLLNKSPKTLSNLFAKYNHKTPQQIIQERIILEAKRLLQFTDKPAKEISFDLGFDDPAHFSRFFRKSEQLSPNEFKNNLKKV